MESESDLGLHPPWVRWLAVPLALLVLLLAALAVSAESRQEYLDRQAVEAAAGDEPANDPSSGSPSGQSRTAEHSGSGGSGGSATEAGRLIIQTENGPVELTLDGQTASGQGSDGAVLALQPDPAGDIVGFRVDGDGTFKPVRRGEPTEDMTLLGRMPTRLTPTRLTRTSRRSIGAPLGS
ncbi:MAG: hypothetical protein ACI8TP_000391 [Acidimicrobiales bacterium]|jgi:hypothetical protein